MIIAYACVIMNDDLCMCLHDPHDDDDDDLYICLHGQDTMMMILVHACMFRMMMMLICIFA